jgi:sulfite exporter TauE/SafE
MVSVDALPLALGGLAAGLLAGSATCTAVQGGLLVGLARPSGAGRATGCGATPGHGTGCGHGCAPAVSDGRVVAAFAAGRFASHVLAGALLGLLGGAVRLGPTPRAVLLVAAGILVVALAARLLRRARPRGSPGPAAAGCRCTPAGRAPGRVRALALGAATVLVPCGTTLGVEAVAVSTGSAAGGALVMAAFAAGSTPAFAVLGLLLRRAAATRFAAIAGAVAILAGLWTIASGLRLGGWLPELGTPPASAATAMVRPDGVQTVTVWATAEGYRPAVVVLRANVPTEVVFRVTDDAGCARTLSLEGRDLALPATVRLPPRPPGPLRYACGMGMYPGVLHFR